MLYISIAVSVLSVSIIIILVIIAKLIKIQIEQTENFNKDVAFIFSGELLENLKKFNAKKMKDHVLVKMADGNYIWKKIDGEY